MDAYKNKKFREYVIYECIATDHLSDLHNAI